MEYNFTDEILDIIKHKTTDLFNKLDESITNQETEVEKVEKVEQNLETEVEKVEQNLKTEVEKVEQNLETEVEKVEQNLETEVEQNLETEVEQNLEVKNPDSVSNTEDNVNKDKLILDFLEKFKLFHNDSRANISLLKYIIHKKIGKIKESDNLILFKELNKFTNNKEITELIWDYIHSVYLLHEYALLEPNKEILTALIKKINVEDEGENNNSNSLTIIEDEDEKEEDKDIFDKIKDKKEFKMFNDVFNSITKNMEVDPTTANTNFIDDIMDDIRTNINNSDGVDDLFNSTKNIGEKYKNMYNDGKINMNDLMSSMMKIISNPKDISKTIKDINVKKIPDMSSIMNKLVTEVQSSDDIKNMMNSDMLKNINFDPNKKDFNPMDIISNMMSGTSTSTTLTSTDETPLTNEQITEMENFYSNLNIGNETNE